MKRRHGSLVLLLVLACAAPAQGAGRDVKAPALARDRAAAAAALEHARDLRSGRGVVNGYELTPALAQLSARYEALSPSDRMQADRLLARPTDGDADPQLQGWTVPEHAPYCTANFCLHWVTSTDDAPDLTDTDGDDVPDYVETMAAQFEFVRTRENGDLGWRMPVSDGAKGGDGKLDVYLAELAGTNVLGYAATDPGQADPHEKFGYMVMDDDLDLGTLQVTAAHEYNHILQFAYDAAQDTWMFESTAIWMEDLVFDAVDHYVGFIPGWAALDMIPLARTFQSKHYGSGVWNMWLDARHGPALIRSAWSGSRATSPASFAPAAYGAALTAGGHEGFSASFGRFSAAVAEWRTASQFPEGPAYPDAVRRGNLAVGGAAVSPRMDHTTYAMYTVPQPAGGWPAVLRLDGELPAGVAGSLALVGRTGTDPLAGTVTTQLQQLPAGGAGSIQLEDPASYGRITAVLVNADVATTGFSGGEWVFANDGEPFTAAAGASGAVSEAPVNSGLPVVSGTPRDGSVLSAANSAWSGSAPMGYARRWRRCDDDNPASCATIPGATGATYTATESDVGKRLRVEVTATNGAGSAAAESAPTAAVVAVAPANLTPPAIDDPTPVVGQALSTSDGTWSGSKPLAITYQWRRCDTLGLPSCSDIADATGPAYTVTAADTNKFLRVLVTAANTGGSASRVSAATQQVPEPPPAPPTNTARPTVAGTARDGESLTAADGTWTGSPTLSREWLRCDAAGAGCTGTGVTAPQYLLAAGDVGHALRVRVKAVNGGGTRTADSDPTGAVEALAPAPAAAPVVSGDAVEGSQLTSTTGTWDGTAPTFAREWLRCDDDSVPSCVAIGATGATYRLTTADIGRRMRVRVTASNDAGSASALSEPTAAVALRPPVNTTPPAITGEARQGATLTSLAGTWTGSPPILLLRRWERCTSGALTCTAIDRAVGEKYTLGLADVLTHVRVVITADNGEVASAASALVGPIAASTAGGGTTPPPPPPPPPAQPATLSATITAPAKAKLAKALAGKLSVLADCTAACKVTSRLELARKDARKLKIPAVIATGSATRSTAGRATVRLKFTAKARKRLRKARKLTATLTTQARDGAGAVRSQQRAKLTLAR